MFFRLLLRMGGEIIWRLFVRFGFFYLLQKIALTGKLVRNQFELSPCLLFGIIAGGIIHGIWGTVAPTVVPIILGARA